MSDDIVEGVLAIHKPQSITSAQVVRDVQAHFKKSALFAPWLKNEADRLYRARSHHHKSRFRKEKQIQQVKIGHGGTLDPLATGVLILGIGSGTKRLPEFLGCTKSYDAVVLFGQATDTYDVTGKTVASKEFSHITKEQVESALERFRGPIMQRPPIYSALSVQGKKLYEYAREGKEVPIEIKERPITVHELEMLEWYPGGSHQFHWPTVEADQAEKTVAAKVIEVTSTTEIAEERGPETGTKRARDSTEDAQEAAQAVKKVKTATDDNKPQEDDISGSIDEETQAPRTDRAPCPAPACRLRMTVNSGFYVRSLCHDLGAAVGSLGLMVSLVRTRQGDYVVGENLVEYADLEKGEEHWGPIVKRMLGESTSSKAEETEPKAAAEAAPAPAPAEL